MQIDAVEGLTHALFEESGDALFLFYPETEELLDANAGAERLTGLTRQELSAHPATYWFRFGGKGGQQRLREAASKSGVFHAQDGYFLRTRDEGVWIPVNLTVARLHVLPKTLALVTARDAREQRAAFDHLQQLEGELRRVLNAVSDCLWSATIDEQGRWTLRYLSPVVERITGRPAEYFLGGLARWDQVVFPEDRPHWRESVAELRVGHSVQPEYRIVLPDGSTRWVQDTARVSAGEPPHRFRVDGILTEITARKQAENDLKKVNAYLDSIVEHVPIMLFVKDAASLRFELFNRAGEKLLGYQRADLIGKNDYDFFPPIEAEFFIQKDREVLAGKQLVEIPEEEIETRAGRKVLRTLKIPILDEEGTPRYLLGISEDITARKALEVARRQAAEDRDRYARTLEAKNQALAASELRYRELTEATLDAIVVTDGAGTITLFNPAAERLFAVPADQVLGHSVLELLAPDAREPFRMDLQQYLHTKTGRFVGQSSELSVQRRDGTILPVELALSPLEQGAAVQFQAALRDLSERNRMRTVLAQSEKLASIGRLSAGIAHEINNPLAYVSSNVTVLGRDVAGVMELLALHEEGAAALPPELREKIRQLADDIDLAYIRDNLPRLVQRTREGLDRVTRIVHSLRGHARLAPVARQAVAIPDLVDSSLEILQSKLHPHDIQVERDYADPPRVTCIASDVNQVILNLLVNACQAIDATPKDQPGHIRIGIRPVGPDLVIEIADNGCGIDPENLPKLFDPFFTTKDVQEGTGLGLWITHNIITAHGGRLDVDSVPGRGTCFRMTLPLDGAGH